MKTFKRFILEQEEKEAMALDLEFIRRAEQVTSFNLSPKDFSSVKHKNEIQHLFNKHFFPGFDLKNTIKGTSITVNSLNNVITKLKSEDSKAFSSLHNYNLKGIGPAEVMMYFIIDKAYLGGGSSAGLDLIIEGGAEYEIKAISLGRDGYAYDFKVGGTIPLSGVISKLVKLRNSLSLPGSATEISQNVLKDMKLKAPKEYKEIEKEYQSLTYNGYFKNHDIIFVNNKTSRIGYVESIKRVKPEDIVIYHVTSGTIKPKVKI
jgi:hypothetical protein